MALKLHEYILHALCLVYNQLITTFVLLCTLQKWNSVGIILQYNTEEENSINVEFHDSSTHHALHVTNTMGHSMADLSTEAVLLACHADEDEEDTARLVT